MEEQKSEEKKRQKANAKRIAEGVLGVLTVVGGLFFNQQLKRNNNNKA